MTPRSRRIKPSTIDVWKMRRLSPVVDDEFDVGGGRGGGGGMGRMTVMGDG
jgi:hypothetical protein